MILPPLAIILLILLLSLRVTAAEQTNQFPAPTISVENPIEVNTSDVSLSWDELDDTNFYRFELCSDASCDNKIKEIPKTDSPSVSLSNIKNGQYFWRVNGVDKNNQIGLFTTPQPLLVHITPILINNITASESTQENLAKKDFKTLILNLPWYIYLIILAYIIFTIRTLFWYFNK